jgi:hypothetical protein
VGRAGTNHPGSWRCAAGVKRTFRAQLSAVSARHVASDTSHSCLRLRTVIEISRGRGIYSYSITYKAGAERAKTIRLHEDKSPARSAAWLHG